MPSSSKCLNRTSAASPSVDQKQSSRRPPLACLGSTRLPASLHIFGEEQQLRSTSSATYALPGSQILCCVRTVSSSPPSPDLFELTYGFLPSKRHLLSPAAESSVPAIAPLAIVAAKCILILRRRFMSFPICSPPAADLLASRHR